MATTDQTTLTETGIESPPDYEGQVGDGKAIPTVIESDGERERCPYCGNWYKRVGTHWVQSDCPCPPISQYKMELLKGMQLGDGSIDVTNKNPRMDIKMINKTFLEWLSQELGWVVGDVRKTKTSVESAQRVRESLERDTQPEDVFDLYSFKTRSHPQLQRFADWYGDNGIVFPPNLSVTSTTLKLWYVSDGGLRQRERESGCVRISSANEKDRPDAILDALEKHGFTVGQSRKHFRLSTDDTKDFFDLIGDPVPGFEYKWAWQDYDRYHRLKNATAHAHCTQTLE